MHYVNTIHLVKAGTGTERAVIRSVERRCRQASRARASGGPLSAQQCWPPEQRPQLLWPAGGGTLAVSTSNTRCGTRRCSAAPCRSHQQWRMPQVAPQPGEVAQATPGCRLFLGGLSCRWHGRRWRLWRLVSLPATLLPVWLGQQRRRGGIGAGSSGGGQSAGGGCSSVSAGLPLCGAGGRSAADRPMEAS